MNIRVSKSQFKAKALEYFRQVEATGQPIIVTDHGKPVAEVRPFQQQQTQEELLAKLRGSVTWYDEPFEPALDPEEWEVLK